MRKFLLDNNNKDEKLPSCVRDSLALHQSIWLQQPIITLPYATLVTFYVAVNWLPVGTYHDWNFTTKAIATYFLSKALYVLDLTFPLLAMLKVGTYQELNR